MNDLVSIVTTLYNYRRFVGELCESVLRQTYGTWEHIIVDDGSTDNPMGILRAYMAADIRFRCIRLFANGGYSRAKNVGIRASNGDYIVMIDADDMLTAKSIELRKAALDANPNSLWCHGEVLVQDGNGKALSDRSRTWKRNFRKKLLGGEFDGRKWDLTREYHHRLVHAQSVMVRPEIHKRLGLYDESLRFSSDNEMWRRFIRFGYVPAHIEDYVAIYRVHPDRMARSPYKRERAPAVKKQIIKDVERRHREGINAANTPLWT